MRSFIPLLAISASLFAAGAAASPEPWIVPEVARACPRFGPGFVEVPGTGSCVRIGGRVTTDYTIGSAEAPRAPGTGFGANARLGIDLRTETDYGPLRLMYQLDTSQDRARRR